MLPLYKGIPKLKLKLAMGRPFSRVRSPKWKKKRRWGLGLGFQEGDSISDGYTRGFEGGGVGQREMAVVWGSGMLRWEGGRCSEVVQAEGGCEGYDDADVVARWLNERYVAH